MKFIFFSAFFFVFFFVFFVSAQQNIPTELAENLDSAKAVKENITKYTDTELWNERWNYIGESWKEILLRNKAVFYLDSSLQKISFIFLFFFAKPYSLSLSLLGIILIWLFVFGNIADIMKASGFFGNWTISVLASLFFTIILAHLKLFEGLLNLVLNVVFSPGFWLIRLFVFIGVLLFFIALFYVRAYLSKYLIAIELAKKTKEVELKGKEIIEIAKGLEKGSED